MKPKLIKKFLFVVLMWAVCFSAFGGRTKALVISSQLNASELTKACLLLITSKDFRQLNGRHGKSTTYTESSCKVAGQDEKSGLFGIYVEISPNMIIGTGYSQQGNYITDSIMLRREDNLPARQRPSNLLQSENVVLTIATVDSNELTFAVNKVTGKQIVLKDTKHLYRPNSDFQQDATGNTGGKLNSPVRPQLTCANVCAVVGVLSCVWGGPAAGIICGLAYIAICNWICNPTPVH